MVEVGTEAMQFVAAKRRIRSIIVGLLLFDMTVGS